MILLQLCDQIAREVQVVCDGEQFVRIQICFFFFRESFFAENACDGKVCLHAFVGSHRCVEGLLHPVMREPTKLVNLAEFPSTLFTYLYCLFVGSSELWISLILIADVRRMPKPYPYIPSCFPHAVSLPRRPPQSLPPSLPLHTCEAG